MPSALILYPADRQLELVPSNGAGQEQGHPTSTARPPLESFSLCLQASVPRSSSMAVQWSGRAGPSCIPFRAYLVAQDLELWPLFIPLSQFRSAFIASLPAPRFVSPDLIATDHARGSRQIGFFKYSIVVCAFQDDVLSWLHIAASLLHLLLSSGRETSSPAVTSQLS